jgi:hypothetical protein
VASVGTGRRVQAVSGASEISEIQHRAVQEDGGERTEDGLEAMWQSVHR